MPDITTQYSIWFLPVCLIAGFLYALILYRKETKFDEAPKPAKKLMFFFRFLGVSITAFLLLSPFVDKTGKKTEKPYIIFLRDNSESLAPDSTKIKNTSNKISSVFANDADYRFKKFIFDETIKENDNFDFSGKETDIAKALSDIKERFYNQNIGAVILLSDGIFNKGNNPVYEVKNLDFPIYTVAEGDTSDKKDVLISKVKYNKTAFLNSGFPLRIKIKASKLKEKNTRLVVYDNDKSVYEKNITIDSDNFYKTYNLTLKADKTGFHKIKTVVKTLKDEITDKNNTKEIIIEVTDKKQKILILSDAPHPDIAAIRESLKLNRNFETEYYTVNKFNKAIKQYDLIILNQVPSKYNYATNILDKIRKNNISVIYMLGINSSLVQFDKLNTGLATGGYSNSPDEVNGIINKNFDLFDINQEIKDISANSPPLLSPFGDYKTEATGKVLFYREINGINTGQPLMVFFSGNANAKNCVITGEGLWRWKLYDYKTNKNNFLFNDFINASVQYLISKERKERFEIIAEKIIPENRNIIIKAKAYDKNYNLTEVNKVTFTLIDSTGKNKIYQPAKQGKIYSLNLKKLPVGDYYWKAETIIDGEKFKKEGIFSVISVKTEYMNLKANHKTLKTISGLTGGKTYYPENISRIYEDIKNNENIKPISYYEKETEEIINFKLLFFIILTLFMLEWFIRKYYGGY